MRKLLVFLLVLGSATVFAQSGRPILDSDLGLSKGSVFDTPTPPIFDYEGGPPIVRNPASQAPPLIPHPISGYVPITPASNMCLACHERPADAGKPAAAGEAQAIPLNHYVKSGKELKLNRAMYDCQICHAPAANVKPLVGNSAR
ncbi:MAG: nitrate reductase cytochrome c-type subunit [Burkholderiaceae bacterium]